MALPPLYKYLSVHGAKLTLGNKTFKHAKPTDFNDIKDLTIQDIFSEETEVALRRLESGFTDVILQHLNDRPTCSSPLKEKLILIQRAYRNNPDLVEKLKTELAKQGRKPVFDIDQMRARSEVFIKETNQFMQGYRVLCVTTYNDSDKMWSDYAEDHKGIVLRIEPDAAKDSKFQLFRPVTYREKRPSLYDDTLEFLADSLFGDQGARSGALLQKIVYAKTLEWQHEGEYRLAIPMRQGEKPWDTLPYHPEEIIELYLGEAMNAKDKQDIIEKARVLNPNIKIFQAKRGIDGKLAFAKAL
jgi:Protein of unknown function (DUF2971)